ncbi:ABC transporter ATP-binding protein [Lacibacterium aquatile]|uniref:ABC transporter ATP-binding protein n=1 Tax=Lacibacterium aquatile TaxID=1168082 RepID=A0ABW5DY94_9PROT
MLVLDNLTKTYPGGTLAVSRFALTIEPGEIVAILGGSGCGKSTVLRAIAGLDPATGGRVLLDGEEIRAPHSKIGVAFQEPRLMPWLSIAENIGFGIQDIEKAKRQALVKAALERVGLSGFAGAWPRELSGGMAQRAALARALVAKPEVLLLDEPFSALDALTRADLQDHLLELWEIDRPTLVLVTHDIDEALYLADRVVVMTGRPGHIQSIVQPNLPRPRDRESQRFVDWRRRLLGNLSLAGSRHRVGEEDHPAAAI